MDAAGKQVKRKDWIVAAVTAVALAALYFITRIEAHNYDAVSTALVADASDWRALFHQNHLLFTPLAWVVLRLIRAVGYDGLALVPLAGISSAFAAAAAAWLFLSFRRLGVATAGALVAAAGAASAAAWWSLAGEAELLSTITFFLVGAMWMLAKPAPRLSRACGVAVWLAVGTWFHMTVALFAPVAAVILAKERAERWRRSGVFAALYGVLAATPYAVASFVLNTAAEEGAVASAYKWITFYHWWGGWGIWRGSNVASALVRLLVAVVAPGPDIYAGVAKMPTPVAAARLAPAVILIAVAVVAVAVAWPHLWRERRVWVVACLLWFASYQAFFTWWEPGNPEWWIGVTLPVWVLVALAFPRRRAAAAVGAAVVLTAAAINFTRVILPATKAGQDAAENAAHALFDVSQAGDLIWVPDEGAAQWLRLLSRGDREVLATGGKAIPGRLPFVLATLADPASPPPREGRGIFISDYELDNAGVVGTGEEAAVARAALFTILYYADAATAVPYRDGVVVYYRYRHCDKALDDLAVNEVAGEVEGAPAVALDECRDVARFDVVTAADGEYVLAVQARAPGRDVPVLVAVDGRWVAAPRVSGEMWAFYEIKAPLAAGPHVVTVTLAAGGVRRDGAFVNRLITYRLQ